MLAESSLNVIYHKDKFHWERRLNTNEKITNDKYVSQNGIKKAGESYANNFSFHLM